MEKKKQLENIIAIYQYKCMRCSNVFDRVLSMKDNKLPESEPCPSCGNYEVLQYHGGAPMIHSGQGIVGKVNSDLKNHLENIKNSKAKYFTQDNS